MAILEAEHLTMAWGDRVIQRDLSFAVNQGEIFVLMGGSGCGKSSLLRHLVGLQAPAAGRVLHQGEDFYAATPERQQVLRRNFGVMFQAGALWSSLTVGENILAVLREFTSWSEAQQEQVARFRLAQVGMGQAYDAYPAALSGGMRKRAAIARALALDPALLFLDEPSAGLDPLSSAHLDDLILGLRNHLGTTVVMVTHELESLLRIADRAVFLDAREKTMTALGDPRMLREAGPPEVRAFLSRGKVA